MELPSYLHELAQQNINNEADVIQQKYLAESRRSLWAIVYKLIPFKDGNSWCVLLGNDLQDGIAGFGNTPAVALQAFEDEFNVAISG